MGLGSTFIDELPFSWFVCGLDFDRLENRANKEKHQDRENIQKEICENKEQKELEGEIRC